MKKLIALIFLSVCGILLLVVSCKKDPVATSTPCTTCQKVTEAKDYFAFKVGTWWVYEEETSLERDSVYVTQSSISSGYNFDTYIYSTYQDYYYHFWPLYINTNVCSETVPVSKKCLYVNRAKQKPGDYVGSDYCFFIKYSVGAYETVTGNIYFPNNKIIVEEILSNYQLGSLSFEKTVKIQELSTLVEGIQPTNHYFSKGIGLVRKELIDSNQVWNLVNYHIEP
jgi:hypothetical protein